MNDETAYPLQWPLGWPRSKWTARSKFGERQSGDVPMTKAVDHLERELQLLGAQHWVISSNVATRLDGKPYGDHRARPGDVGVAVYFTLKAKRTVLACDKWDRPAVNIYAVAKHIEALRGQQRWGVGSVEQAFAGYAALAHRTGPSCWEVLGVPPMASEGEVLHAWRQLATEVHPDVGGTHDKMAEVNAAKDTALATLRSRRAA